MRKGQGDRHDRLRLVSTKPCTLSTIIYISGHCPQPTAHHYIPLRWRGTLKKYMKKAKSIEIRNYRSNIEVYASFGDDNDMYGGRVYHRTIDIDSIPSASYIGTIREIQEECIGDDYGITLAQARVIKNHIKRYAAYAN